MSDEPGLYEGLITTRAIRRYLPDDIPVEDLNEIFFAATRGPSGHNTQPFRFIALRRTSEATEARTILARGFVEAWKDQREEPADDDTSRRARMARTMNDFVDKIAEAPVIVFAIYDRAVAWARHHRWGICLSGVPEFAARGAKAKGYGGVITQWHHPVVEDLARALALPDGVEIAATIPLGKPAGNHGAVRRLPLPELVYENRYAQTADWIRDPDGTRYTGG